jgi:hypothetical protein
VRLIARQGAKIIKPLLNTAELGGIAKVSRANGRRAVQISSESSTVWDQQNRAGGKETIIPREHRFQNAEG